jgi:hypothetical protein
MSCCPLQHVDNIGVACTWWACRDDVPMVDSPPFSMLSTMWIPGAHEARAPASG